MGDRNLRQVSPPGDSDRDVLDDFSSIIQRNFEEIDEALPDQLGLFNPSYGELYGEMPGVTLSLPTAGSFVKWVDDTSSLEGLSAANDLVALGPSIGTITIGDNGVGVYKCNISVSFSGSNNSNVHGVIFLNGVEQEKIEFHRKLSGVDVGNASASGLLQLQPADVLDVRFSSDTAATTITVEHLQFNIIRISL